MKSLADVFCGRRRISELGGRFERASVPFQAMAKRKWLFAEMSETLGLRIGTCVTGWLSGRKEGQTGSGCGAQ